MKCAFASSNDLNFHLVRVYDESNFENNELDLINFLIGTGLRTYFNYQLRPVLEIWDATTQHLRFRERGGADFDDNWEDFLMPLSGEIATGPK